MPTYSINEKQLPIKVTVGANDASATICWVGLTTPDGDECIKCSDEKIYCENVYIGTNDCVDGESSARTISADSATTTISWHDIPIPYEIIQKPAICSTCGEIIESCEILNHWVSPYVVTPTMSSTTLYWEYWFTKEDDCDIIREKILSSTTIDISTDIPCDQKDRVITGDVSVSCDKTIRTEYYIQKPDVCCDLSGDCYEINEITYNPTTVPSSGGLVNFSFDYKRVEVDENCETKETYGTYFGQWNVPECKGDDCCYSKAVESAFTWNDICGRGDVPICNITSNSEYDDGDLVHIPPSGGSISFSSTTLNDKNTVYLSILREKSFSADCEIHCDFDTLYCVDKSTIKTEYYDYDTGAWSAFTDYEYVYPYYGGRLRVSWEYYIITIYEDCEIGVSKGNPYVDTLTITEYNDCKDHEDVDTFHVTVKGELCTTGGTARIYPEGMCSGKSSKNQENEDETEECKITDDVKVCIGKTATIRPLNNVVVSEIPYEFKKGLCPVSSAVKRNLPDYLQHACDGKENCNEFAVTFYQYKKECNPDCVPCFYNYMIDDVPSAETIVTRETRRDCDLKVFAYGDGEMNGDTFKNDCSGWVTADTNEGSVTFTIAKNEGPYRRGKVIFIHDDKCKEEIVINQNGIDNEGGDYKPDPGYTCDLKINDLEICIGDTGTISPNGGGGGGSGKTCDETNVSFTPDSTSIKGCEKTYRIGEYHYNCANFDKNNITISVYPSIIYPNSIIIEDPNTTTKSGTIRAKFHENTGATRTTSINISYNNQELVGSAYELIQPKGEDCGGGDVNFQNILDGFNDIIEEQQTTHPSYRKVEANTDLYNYLYDAYEDAINEYESSNSPLFAASTYEEVFKDGSNSQWGSYDRYETDGTALKAMTTWLMAMQLSEIYGDYGASSTNTQTKFYQAAYDLLEDNHYGRTIPLYGNFTLKGDVTIARLAASAIYAKHRREKTFDEMDRIRSSATGRLAIDKSGDWNSLESTIPVAPCGTENTVIGYSVNANEIFPQAPGPFATNSNACSNDNPSQRKSRPSEQPSGLFNSSTQNYLFDEAVYNHVVAKYNIDTTDNVYFNRLVQANADGDDWPTFMFGNETYYEYKPNLQTKFWPAKPVSTNAHFVGPFSSAVTKVNLSSSLTYPNNHLNDTKLKIFFTGIRKLAGNARFSLLNPQYGRRRPGQGEKDYIIFNNTNLGTARFMCGDLIENCHNCNDPQQDEKFKMNYQFYSSLELMKGSGTKVVNGFTFVDLWGNGVFVSDPQHKGADPYIGDEDWSGVGNICHCALHRAHTYPSGHASEWWAGAIILMLLLSEDRITEIYKAAFSYTVSRTILRVHWNSDIMYGRLIGTMIAPVINAFGQSSEQIFGGYYRHLFNATKDIIDNAPHV